jgi:protein phosphatase
MVQISEDHTYRNLVSAADTVPSLPEKLTRFLDGRKDGRSPDLTTLQLHPGDRLLLCSDGLSSYVSPDAIRAALASRNDSEEVANRLVALALDHGGDDNVTVIVIDVERRRPPPAGDEATPQQRQMPSRPGHDQAAR